MTFVTLKESEATQPEWNRRAKDVINAHSRALEASGTTTGRPAKSLYAGQFYFDTDLGIPIWWSGADWIDATGTAA